MPDEPPRRAFFRRLLNPDSERKRRIESRLAPCPDCGRPSMDRQLAQRTARATGQNPDDLLLCPDCRLKRAGFDPVEHLSDP